MKVYLIRHAQSEDNAQGLQRRLSQNAFNAYLDASSNIPLTALGIQQSYCAASTLAKQSIERLYTSPYSRALTTARIVGQSLNLAPEIVPDLREVMPGPLPESQCELPLVLHFIRGYVRLARPHQPYESWIAAYRRANRVWQLISSEPATAIAVVTHFAFLHVLLIAAHIQWRGSVRSLHLHNGGITCVEIHNPCVNRSDLPFAGTHEV